VVLCQIRGFVFVHGYIYDVFKRIPRIKKWEYDVGCTAIWDVKLSSVFGL